MKDRRASKSYRAISLVSKSYASCASVMISLIFMSEK